MTASALSDLLRRAKAKELERAAPAPAPAGDPWPAGAEVVRELAGLERLRGRVAFVDGGWIYWAAEDGSVHASTFDVMRRTG